jgi:hypothetical protein
VHAGSSSRRSRLGARRKNNAAMSGQSRPTNFPAIQIDVCATPAFTCSASPAAS